MPALGGSPPSSLNQSGTSLGIFGICSASSSSQSDSTSGVGAGLRAALLQPGHELLVWLPRGMRCGGLQPLRGQSLQPGRQLGFGDIREVRLAFLRVFKGGKVPSLRWWRLPSRLLSSNRGSRLRIFLHLGRKAGRGKTSRRAVPHLALPLAAAQAVSPDMSSEWDFFPAGLF
jgi:hypothetical protein